MEREFHRVLSGRNRFAHMRATYNNWPDQVANTLALAESEGRAGLYATALHRLRKLLAADPAELRALKLYVRLDRESRQGYPEYLAPGPGIGLPSS
jgi:hypothetical protein